MTEPFFNSHVFEPSGIFPETLPPQRAERVKTTRVPDFLIRGAAAAGLVVLSLGQVAASETTYTISPRTIHARGMEAPYRPTWRSATLKELGQLRHLPDNWDGHGAIPIGAIDKASAVLDWLWVPGLYAPTVIPSCDGGIQFEWHPGKFDLEILIEPSGQVLMVWGPADGAMKDREVFGPDDVAPAIQALVATLT